MEALIIEPTENSPKVILDPDNNKFEISGESRPEDVRKFYEPVLEWLDQYNKYLYWLLQQNPGGDSKKVQFNFIFEYFNSSSAKYIMDIMFKLGEIVENEELNVKVEVNWHYDEPDEDMLEAGEEFENITDIPFNFVIIED